MAVSKLFRLINFALALILLLLVKSNSSEKFDHNARANDAADPVRRISSLIDSSGKLRIGNERQFERNSRDVFAVMESNSINTAEDVKSYEGEEKKRNKWAVPLPVPLVVPMLQTITALYGIKAGGNAPNNPPDDPCKDGKLNPLDQPDPALFQRPTTKQFQGLAHGKFANLESVRTKVLVKNSIGLLRPRWKDKVTGEIYEWDSQHGELEVYDKSGKPLRVLDPCTGNDKDKDISDRHPVDP